MTALSERLAANKGVLAGVVLLCTVIAWSHLTLGQHGSVLEIGLIGVEIVATGLLLGGRCWWLAACCAVLVIASYVRF